MSIRESPPVTRRLRLISGKLIAAGAPGDRLPSDAELCEQYGVSRMTARQAVQLVATDGLIDRRRGAGTFVRTSICAS